MLRGEVTNINFIVFNLTRSVLEPTIYHTQGEHGNHYTTDELVVLEGGWETVDEYLSVTFVSEDEKRIRAAENRTMKKI